MTNQELLVSIQSLPPSQQLELANTILDRLAESGTWPISDEMKQMLDQRADAADANPDRLRPLEKVFDHLRAHRHARK
jgi:putative addiction module component (TIGR02574 family)